jgi:hypothetical protein
MSKKRKSPKRMKRKAERVAKKKSAAKPKPKAKKKRALSKRRTTTARTKAEPARQPLRRPATMYSILHPGVEMQAEPDFRDAPEGWTRADAQTLAVKMGHEIPIWNFSTRPHHARLRAGRAEAAGRRAGGFRRNGRVRPRPSDVQTGSIRSRASNHTCADWIN